MEKTVLTKIYESYLPPDYENDTKNEKEVFNELFDLIEKTLSIELNNEIFCKVVKYAQSKEENGFKNGFKYAMQLVRECGI